MYSNFQATFISFSFSHPRKNSKRKAVLVCVLFSFKTSCSLIPGIKYKTPSFSDCKISEKNIIMNWQVNRATPAVLITHECQKAWHSLHQHIPGVSPSQVSVSAQAHKPWKWLILCDVQMIHRHNQSNLHSSDGQQFLVQTHCGLVCSPNAN